MSENIIKLDSEVEFVLILGKMPVEIVILVCVQVKICWGAGTRKQVETGRWGGRNELKTFGVSRGGGMRKIMREIKSGRFIMKGSTVQVTRAENVRCEQSAPFERFATQRIRRQVRQCSMPPPPRV